MKKIKKLSIVIPVYNEKKTIEKVLEKVNNVNLGKIEKEIILVDDGSTDGSLELLKRLKQNKKYDFSLIVHAHNQGKSTALRRGFKSVSGDVVVVQDGDLEYDPNDFVKMLGKMEESGAKVVYGSRRLEKKNKQYSGLSFYLGGLFLTEAVNLLYGAKITDEPTCYKMFDTKLLNSLNLTSKRFEFCPEVTAKVLKSGETIYEVPIVYNPRHVDQGKKIKFSDFFEALWTLLKYRFVK